jgi:tripartite-type tricarboxylate transporter receptor subunit TctC
MRSLLAIVERELKQEIILENRAGGSGIIGTRALVESAPDGYTIGQIPYSILRYAHLVAQPFNPLTDIDYICRTAGQSFGMVVRASSPLKSIADLIGHAKARPGHLTYGHSGFATSGHVGMEMFLSEAGIELADVPHKGGAPALSALLNGKVDVVADSTAWASQVQSGKLRLLAVWTEKRIPLFPHAPTLKELGYSVVMTAPNGVGAPKGLDLNHKARLREVFRNAVLSDKFRVECEALGAPVMYLDSDEYRDFAAQAFAAEGKLVERMKLRQQLADQAGT